MIFLSFFLIFISTKGNGYDIEAPFYDTDVNEIENWSLKGSSTNLKKSIRLTPSLPNLVGFLCHRIPFSFKSWSLSFNFTAKDGTGGDSLFFLFSDIFCPSFDDQIRGLILQLDLKSNRAFFEQINNLSINDFLLSQTQQKQQQNNNKTKLKISQNVDFDIAHVSDTFSPYYENFDGYMKITIQKISNYTKIDYLRGNQYKELFFNEDFDEEFDGYLTFIGTTSESFYDNIDIQSIYVSDSLNLINSTEINYSKINKKKIETNYEIRKQNKERRRAQILPLMNEIYKEIQEKNHSLTNADSNQDLSIAIKLIDEAHNRMKLTMTFDDLEKNIQQNVSPIINLALKKVNLQAEKLSDLHRELDLLYSDLQSKMLKMVNETEIEMNSLMNQILNIAKDLSIHKMKPEAAGNLLDQASNPIKESFKSMIIPFICLIETVAYVIFFISKRKYINRKYD